jgi:hypothetical protein
MLNTNAFLFSTTLFLRTNQPLLVFTFFRRDAIFSLILFSEGVPMEEV